MDRSWYGRLGVLLGLCVLAVYLLVPSYVFYFKASPEQRENNQAFCKSLPKWAPCHKLNLGLDLQGGVHLVLGVRVDKAISHRMARMAESLEESLRKQPIGDVKISHERGTPHLVAHAVSANDQTALKQRLRDEAPGLEVERSEAQDLILALSFEETAQLTDGAVEQTIKTLRNRADKLGVTEPTIARRGRDSVLIQLPGVKDPERAIDIIGRTAQLEFAMVDEAAALRLLEASGTKALPDGVSRHGGTSLRNRSSDPFFELPDDSQAAVEALLAPLVPSDKALAFGAAQTPLGTEKPGFLRTYVVEGHPGLTGDALTNAQVAQNPEMPGDYHVVMSLDAAGAKRFDKLTADNIGRRMAILLDGKVTSAPGIRERIGGGTAQITLGRGGDSQSKFQEAKDLTLVLKAGALPAPIEVREKRQVGKSLGQDTVARGTLAMGVGAGLVVLFMALYYRASGMMANIALVLNVLFMLAILAFLEATLTLPGMAGIVLTVGMAVDANVLIFERIREEMRAGQKPRFAIEAGYKKAFATIFDANVTTLIAGVVLMQYGSGPVRGFAVTLIIGLTCSLYTAIVVTRLIHDFLSRRVKLETLSI